MLNIITLMAFTTVALTLHTHHFGLSSSDFQHNQANASNFNTQNKSASIKTLIDNTSRTLTQKNSNKYGSLISDLQQIKQSLDKLQQTLVSYHILVNQQIALCPGVTTFNRTQIRTCMVQLESQTSNAVKYLSTCLDCELVSHNILQIQNGISTYDQKINKTLDGQFCKGKSVSGQKAVGLVDLKNSYFKSNLKVDNWYYGSTTASDYKIYIFKRSSTFNLTSCPLSKPFVSDKDQVCFNCPPGSIFNLGTQLCDTCKANEILNVKSGKCEECFGQKINVNEQQVCRPCILSQGYLLNQTSYKCQKCGKNSYLDAQKRVCVNINCDANIPRFNLATKTCEPCQKSEVIDQNDATRCIKTNYIGICPPQTPRYDYDTKLCAMCPTGRAYNRRNNECEQENLSHFVAEKIL